MTDAEHRLLTTQEAADAVHVSVSTVRKWASRGLLTRWTDDDLGRPLYLEADVLEAERTTRKQPRGRPRAQRVA